MTELCTCGQPATTKLYVHYKYPRRRHEPDAMDPWFVHGGGWHALTCGDPGCEPAAFLAARERVMEHMVLGYPPDLAPNAAQLAGLDLIVSADVGGWVP